MTDSAQSQVSSSNDDSEMKSVSINHAQFEELRELLDDEFNRLIKTYMQDSVKRVSEMRHALNENDNSAGFEAAHSLKGASANLGAHRLNNLCHDMQEACRANIIALQTELLDNIAQEVQVVNNEIESLIDG